MVIHAITNWLASRARKEPITTIVLHATDGRSVGSSISWLRKIGLSYHAVCERDGVISKCVPLSRVAFHAGKSKGPFGDNVNRYSLGFSLANWESRNEKVTEAQEKAISEWVANVCRAYPSITHITTHYWISPGRKTDPAMLNRLIINDIAAANNLKVFRG